MEKQNPVHLWRVQGAAMVRVRWSLSAEQGGGHFRPELGASRRQLVKGGLAIGTAGALAPACGGQLTLSGTIALVALAVRVYEAVRAGARLRHDGDGILRARIEWVLGLVSDVEEDPDAPDGVIATVSQIVDIADAVYEIAEDGITISEIPELLSALSGTFVIIGRYMGDDTVFSDIFDILDGD
jgi:hypothetical protein